MFLEPSLWLETNTSHASSSLRFAVIAVSLRDGILGLKDYFQNNPAPSSGNWFLFDPPPEVFENSVSLEAFVRGNLDHAYHWPLPLEWDRISQRRSSIPTALYIGLKIWEGPMFPSYPMFPMATPVHLLSFSVGRSLSSSLKNKPQRNATREEGRLCSIWWVIIGPGKGIGISSHADGIFLGKARQRAETLATAKDQGGDAYMAHLGGFLAGLALAALFRSTEKVR